MAASLSSSTFLHLHLHLRLAPSFHLPKTIAIRVKGGIHKYRSVMCASSRREVGVGVGVGVGVWGVGIWEEGEAQGVEMEEEYEKETRQVISQVRGTIEMEKADPKRSTAVAALREASNNWVAKYRRDKQLAGKPSFSNMYSVLNAISGHYISFGPTAPIPTKRKARILEEVETAEKALSKGR